ncbi:MAG: Si-specific NAD(P)(+) transhydrogenase [Deltaproteobacteria bacterium]|nr:Si-specific NAD(P)(+) transhydrogenase [Deltaproteobacteria bacterium]
MTTARKFDLVVIGSGPAGEKGAAQAAYFGKSVALIEKEPVLGGACANTGTLPSKTLRESALALSHMQARGLEQWVPDLPRPLTASTFLHRERLIKDKERARIARNLERHKIERITGLARFVDAQTVEVLPRDGTEPTQLTADYFLIATGSRPNRPAWIPFVEEEVYDSDEILQIEHVPETMLVLGSGVIASEYACMFAAIGTQVTMLDTRDRLLGFIDGELGAAFSNELVRMGLNLSLGDAPTTCAVDAATRICTVGTKSGKTYQAQAVLAAAGRMGNSDALGLDKVGIARDSRGNVPVNEHFQTSVPHIYAAGDIVGVPALAATSMEQGRVAMCHAFKLSYKTRVSPVLPVGIYTIPEISYVGATEEELKKSNTDYLSGRAQMRDNARGEILGQEAGFLKLLFSPDKKILGVHAMGPNATEIIHVGQMAMLQGSTIDLFIEAVFNYPTLSELYKYAAYDGLGAIARRNAQAQAQVKSA